MKKFWTNLKMFLWLTVLTGIIYPLVVTGLAHLTMKNRAEGDFISVDGKIVGATLIAQKFEGDKYFWGRPSAVDYNPLPSGGSNLGPTSAILKKAVADRKAQLIKAHSINEKDTIPSELLFASGSGLDPHLTPAAVHFQLDRVIKARGWDEKRKEEILKIINHLTESRRLGFLGEPHVNVLKLNLSLDELDKQK